MHFDVDLFKTAQVLGYPIDFKLVMRHLKQDMRDDWYADTLGYADIFGDHDYAMSVILGCLDRWDGEYLGDTRVVRPIPKKGFAERYSLETDFFDRFVYQSICTFLIPHIDPLLSHRVLSYRYDKRASEDKYLFQNKIGKWLDFQGLTYRFEREGGFLAATDVSNFFENVSSCQVIDSLTSLVSRCDCSGHEKGHIRSAIRVLNDLMKSWSYSGDTGLPQNRDASSFLSNVLLSKVDFRMTGNGFDYYRYVDDIRIVCSTESDARKSLQETIGLLREVGMNINSSKTKILSVDSSADEVHEFFPSRLPSVVAIENMWRSRSRRVVMRSIEHIVEIVRASLVNGDTQSRSFRFAINRLSQVADAGLFDVGGASAEGLLNYALTALESDAVSSDQTCRLIRVLAPNDIYLGKLADFLVDRRLCIHEWQNHLLWILLASRQFSRDDLQAAARKIVEKDPGSGEASGVFIWLQATSCVSIVEDVIDSYAADWPYQNQRYFLMALSGCSAKSIKRLRGKVPNKLLGTIDRSKKEFGPEGVAIRSDDKPLFSSLYDDIQDYS